jgi:hypothetical protein
MSDDITLPPGAVEATRIRELYTTAVAGVRAYVEMGFRLMDTKARLPHGQYIAWCDKHLAGLSRPVLFRAKTIAEGLVKCFQAETFGSLPPAALELIDGHAGHRALLATIQEYRHDETEETSRIACEKRWKEDLRGAQLRDEWYPRIMAGEVTYTQALSGMNGSESAGKKRPDACHFSLLRRDFTSIATSIGHWDELTPEQQSALLTSAPAVVEAAPPALLAAWKEAIARKEAENGGGAK